MATIPDRSAKFPMQLLNYHIKYKPIEVISSNEMFGAGVYMGIQSFIDYMNEMEKNKKKIF